MGVVSLSARRERSDPADHAAVDAAQEERKRIDDASYELLFAPIMAPRLSRPGCKSN